MSNKALRLAVCKGSATKVAQHLKGVSNLGDEGGTLGPQRRADPIKPLRVHSQIQKAEPA